MKLWPKIATSVAVATTAVFNWSVSTEAATLTVEQNFTGSTLFDSGFIPSDTMSAVGKDNIVELINGRYSVYRKSDGVPLQTSSLNQFWDNAGVIPSGDFVYDPRVVYDPRSAYRQTLTSRVRNKTSIQATTA